MFGLEREYIWGFGHANGFDDRRTERGVAHPTSLYDDAERISNRLSWAKLELELRDWEIPEVSTMNVVREEDRAAASMIKWH